MQEKKPTTKSQVRSRVAGAERNGTAKTGVTPVRQSTPVRGKTTAPLHKEGGTRQPVSARQSTSVRQTVPARQSSSIRQTAPVRQSPAVRQGSLSRSDGARQQAPLHREAATRGGEEAKQHSAQKSTVPARGAEASNKPSAVKHGANQNKASKEKRQKRRTVIIVVIAVLCTLLIAGLIIGICCATRKKASPPGHYTFSEYVGTIGNPGIGYTHTDWYHTKLGDTKVHDTQGDIVLFFVDLGPFSAGSNGVTDKDGNYTEGVDHDLDASFFAALRGTFENCRKNGSTIGVRFRYDENGRDNPEPSTFEQVLRHIAQIKESGILEDYKDILMFVESGFVGKWGEQHGGKYTSLEHKAQLLGAMLDCVPAPVPVTVRTPDIFAKYVGISRSELATYECKEGTDEYRVGLYDDGYMGSNSDLGTYADREKETTWLGKQTTTSYFGGEFSGNIEFAKKYTTYLPENCIPEMYKTHLSYINSNIFPLYKDYTYGKRYAVPNIDNSAYYGQTVYQFIRDHLGYRFVLKTSDLTPEVKKGGTLDVAFSLVNNGFANPVKAQKSEVLLERDGNFVRTDVSLDPTKWVSGCSVKESLRLKIPANLQDGKWNVYLKFSTGNTDMTQFSFRSIRFANRDVWNEALGANYIGSFEISGDADDATDNTFYEEGKPKSTAHLYCLGGSVKTDGKRTSEAEWTDADLLTKEGEHALYAKADEENLYVMANVPHKSKAPVFNLRFTNADTGVSYWLYVQSSGFVYFNHDGETGHVGLQLSYSDAMFEFKVPLYMFALQGGTKFSALSVSIQDSASDWAGRGSIAFSSERAVQCDFTVFTAFERITRRCGEEITLSVEAGAALASVQWFKDGEALTGETNRTLTLTELTLSQAGTYSVRLRTAAGNEKTVQVAELILL